jgi:hypothetical protein
VAHRVLLICKRAAVPTKLQAALREIGIEADLTRNTAGAERGDLRRYGAVAFGRAVSEPDRARMTEAFRTANPTVAASGRRRTGGAGDPHARNRHHRRAVGRARSHLKGES